MRQRQRPNNSNNGSNGSNVSMTNCSKGGIKIRNTGNDTSVNPFEGLNPFDEERNTTTNYEVSNYDELDLNIEHYCREELFKLFGLTNMTLNEDILKNCKKIVLKTHPDKSRLDEKYFIFFRKAYAKLQSIFEFQNKINTKKSVDTNDYSYAANNVILDKVFDTKKNLKEPKDFNNWFNSQFDKHKLEDPNDTGYGDWLNSDQDIIYTPQVTKSNMASEIDKIKKKVQSVTVYDGVHDQNASMFGGSSLMAYDSNFSSGSLFSSDGMGYTDLRQAYVESVIPITEDDYKNIPQFKTVDEYKRNRDALNNAPLSKEESMRKLFKENKQNEEESSALAFYFAQQSEKVQKNQDNFWSGLKQLTNL